MRKIFVIGRDPVPAEFVLGPSESLEISLVVLPGVSCEENVRISLDGEGASASVRGLFLCKGDEKVTLNVDLVHARQGCSSDQLFKGIAGGSARACFNGRILVVKDAQKTKAFQACHSLLLSDKARVEARPQLEIYADDVECSHGATSGSLNPDEQFYMRSRGIPEQEARRLQMISFLSAVMEGLDEEMQGEILSAI
ncbi:MAG: SufD family Fe-S cluster assembly protein [Candidatus Cryptobacteroides sp.]|nr:SufD family Fe-S cluster assembly protein [Candidatus Cryptobacteroides sp.]